MKKKILILCYSELHKDPRVIRQIEALKNEYHITTAGVTASGIEDSFFAINSFNYGFFYTYTKPISFHLHFPYLFRKIISLLITIFYHYIYIRFAIWFNKFFYKVYHNKNYMWRYWFGNQSHGSPNRFAKSMRNQGFNLIIANDIDTLPMALKIAQSNKAKVIFDAHEYSPKEIEDDAVWVATKQPYIIALCKKYINQADFMFTVCDGIMEEYKKEFGVKNISVMTNATKYVDLQPLQVADTKIRLIHHGICSPSRKLEDMIDMVFYLDGRFELDFMLVSNIHVQQYYNSLVERAKNNPKIRFIEPVKMPEIPSFTNKYDIGIFLLPCTNFNYQFALPNKLFEFIQARLAVAISPSPEMSKYVCKYDLGVVADDYLPQSLATQLNALTTEQIMYHKRQSHNFAYQLSAEKNKELLQSVAAKLLQ